MTHAPTFDAIAVDTTQRAVSLAPLRVVMLQTQAEAAGAQEVSRILGLGLTANGCDIHHIYLYPKTAAFHHQAKTYFCASERPAGAAAVGRMFIALVRHLRALRPDAILCFQHYGNLVGALAAKLAGVDVIIANRTSSNLLVPRWLQWLDVQLGRLGLFHRVIVNSEVIEQEYTRYPRAYRARVTRIDHGFAVKRTTLTTAEARRSFGLPAHVTLLGCVARLHPAKNLAAAVRLLSHNQEWHLVLAGQGPERARLVDLARSLAVSDRLILVGELSSERISDFLKSLNVFVFPTIAETFGLAAVEAADAGVPVVANDLQVLREVLANDGQPCAVFVDADDPAAFGGAVQVIVADPSLRAALSASGKGLAGKYSLDAMVGRYADLIEHACRAQGRQSSAMHRKPLTAGE